MDLANCWRGIHSTLHTYLCRLRPPVLSLTSEDLGSRSDDFGRSWEATKEEEESFSCNMKSTNPSSKSLFEAPPKVDAGSVLATHTHTHTCTYRGGVIYDLYTFNGESYNTS